MNDELKKKMNPHQKYKYSDKYCANRKCSIMGQMQLFATENYCVMCGKALISTNSIAHDMCMQYE